MMVKDLKQNELAMIIGGCNCNCHSSLRDLIGYNPIKQPRNPVLPGPVKPKTEIM